MEALEVDAELIIHSREEPFEDEYYVSSPCCVLKLT
jgi:hypothetical protein